MSCHSNQPAASSLPRREFLSTLAATVATVSIVPRHVLGGPGTVAPSDKVNVALVGAGGQGRSNCESLFREPSAQIIALADPAESFSLENFYYKGMGGREPVRSLIETHYRKSTPNHRVATYVDFREMLDREKAIDAILCATPDHLHAWVTTHALRAGKHVFCEKPLTHNIWEAREVARVTRETGLATQMGNIGHSTEDMRKTVEALQAGVIGEVREVHAWVSASRWNPTLVGRPTEAVVIPKGLNWDLWLGPRADRPFHSAYFPVAWRDFWDFGGSNIGDFACHDLDAATWALQLSAPRSIEASAAGTWNQEIAPHGSLIRYQFDAMGHQSKVDVYWYDGGLKPPRHEWLEADFELPRRGVLFVGTRGLLFCHGAGGAMRVFPATRDEQPTLPPPSLVRSQGHHRDWLLACKGGPPASANFEYGARLTEIALLGVLALRSGRSIDWDAEKMQARGFPEAEALLREPIRTGWELA